MRNVLEAKGCPRDCILFLIVRMLGFFSFTGTLNVLHGNIAKIFVYFSLTDVMKPLQLQFCQNQHDSM